MAIRIGRRFSMGSGLLVMCGARAGGRMAVCRLGNGVVPAGIQRVAKRDAPRREPAAAQWTVRADGVDRIVRAAGIETAARPEQWTDQDLVAADEDDDEIGRAHV